MLSGDLVAALEQALSCTLSRSARAVSGGSIHTAVHVDTSCGPVFVKYGSVAMAAQFEAECAGVQALARVNAVRTPKVLACGRTPTHSFAAFEWVDLGSATPASDAVLGEQLARLHAATTDHFGWHRDNFIGASVQRNPWSNSWIEFWRRERLGFQLELAKINDAGARLLDDGARLNERVTDFFAGYTPVPSLIHGDLWSGNRAADAHGQPVIFDPAVYYADREAELAMCHLFGGFSSRFDRAYEHAWPVASGAPERRTLYQLYHVLNHFNLFGGAYHAQAEEMIGKLLAVTRG